MSNLIIDKLIYTLYEHFICRHSFSNHWLFLNLGIWSNQPNGLIFESWLIIVTNFQSMGKYSTSSVGSIVVIVVLCWWLIKREDSEVFLQNTLNPFNLEKVLHDIITQMDHGTVNMKTVIGNKDGYEFLFSLYIQLSWEFDKIREYGIDDWSLFSKRTSFSSIPFFLPCSSN